MPKCSFKLDKSEYRGNVQKGYTGDNCQREVWQHGKCIIHAESENKPVDVLKEEIKESDGDLIGIKLRNIKIQETDLFKGCYMFGAEIVDCDLRGSNLEEAKIIESKIKETNANGSNLYKASFYYTDLLSVDLSGADLRKAKFQEGDMYEVNLTGGNFIGTSFISVDLSDMDFGGQDFSEATLHGTDLSNCVLSDSDFEGADVTGTDLTNTEFGGSNLQNVDFTGCNTENTHFGGTDLTGSKFCRVDLTSAGLGGSKLVDVNFAEADLSGLDLSEQNLRNSNLENTTLVNTDLSGSNLQETNLEFAVLESTDLRGADLQNSMTYQTYFDSVRLDRATSLGDTCYYHESGELDKATWVYREYQQILKDNSLPEKVRKYRVYEKDSKKDLSSSFWVRFVGNISSLAWLYGESWKRIFLTSAATITAYSVLYTISGIETVTTVPDSITIQGFQVQMPEYINQVLSGIYFSILTFSTMGYGDLQPHNDIIRFLAGSEAILGGLLLAAFVFVLGRRATW